MTPLVKMGYSSIHNAQNATAWRFNYGSAVIPHPDKKAKGGEDAFYANESILAVADGVGGWAEHGVDPAVYSRKLCEKYFKQRKRHFPN